jgi:intracellular multiplication protein IcmD
MLKRVKPYLPWIGCFFLLILLSDSALAADPPSGDDKGWGGVAAAIMGSFGNLARLITAGSYLAGLAFSIGAIMSFKQHKDNPTQTPIGKPIGLTFIAAALLFLPSILAVTGYTMFQTGAKTAGPGGTIFSTSGGGSYPK